RCGSGLSGGPRGGDDAASGHGEDRSGDQAATPARPAKRGISRLPERAAGAPRPQHQGNRSLKKSQRKIGDNERMTMEILKKGMTRRQALVATGAGVL